MEYLNRIELRGFVNNVTTYCNNDSKFVKFSLGTNRAYVNREGVPVIEVTWHDVTAWEGRYVQDLAKLVKGARVYVQGRIAKQHYTAQDGTERYVTDVVANRLMVIDSDEPMQDEMN